MEMLTYLPPDRLGGSRPVAKQQQAMGSTSTAAFRATQAGAAATAMQIARGSTGCAVASGRL
jgi:hypothetical protein